MLVVAALGRSALASPDLPSLEARIRRIASGLASVARTHQLVIAHSAGVRFPTPREALPVDLQEAQSAGVVGHLLARELRNVLPGAIVASLLAQAVLPGSSPPRGKADPGAEGAESPPCRIVEMPLLRQLAERDELILCVGCVPVQQDSNALFVAGGARLNHDWLAATLALELGADILLLLTDVAAVFEAWPDTAKRLESFESREPIPASLDAGTIGEKLRAACRFAATPGAFAVIGSAEEPEALVAGRAGTCVARSL